MPRVGPNKLDLRSGLLTALSVPLPTPSRIHQPASISSFRVPSTTLTAAPALDTCALRLHFTSVLSANHTQLVE